MGKTAFFNKRSSLSGLVLAGCLAFSTCLAAQSRAEVAQQQNIVLSATHVAHPQNKQNKAAPKRFVSPRKTKSPLVPYRGWGYLVEKLRQDGISEAELDSVFLDPRMPYFSFISFKLRPREHQAIYDNFRKEPTLQIARAFLEKNKTVFDQAEQLFKVNRHIVAAILLIETHAGKATGNDLVINRLARLASIAEPNNVTQNYENLSKADPSVTLEQVSQRANYLEDTFYPEVLALFELKRKHEADLLTLRGSSAGAFGLPQFLPSSYLKFAVDANKDGKISLFHEADAIWSAAHYLSQFGWQDSAPRADKRKVLWKYNHSDAYIDAALDVSDLLK
ncbi:MAG: lytic murein transglycosylase [Deltaproteobacteria bacterium]|nr:lytic murein transglycosylase [Deltaproteobacteria bacterium]